MKINPEDIVGERFGRLCVSSYLGVNTSHAHEYTCACDCGEQKITTRRQLMSGGTTSCGCYQKAVCWKNRTTHGATRRDANGKFDNPEYRAWAAMKDRCGRASHPSFHNYGGRGITVCVEWLDSFETFLSDVGKRPTDRHSLNRKDNNSGYIKGNVVWSTKIEQDNNKRTNRCIEYKGVSKTLTQWAEEFGLSKQVLRSRLDRGWSIGESLETPARRIKQHSNYGKHFDEASCLEIKRLVAGGLSRSEVARMHSVTTTTISRIVDNLGAYRHA